MVWKTKRGEIKEQVGGSSRLPSKKNERSDLSGEWVQESSLAGHGDGLGLAGEWGKVKERITLTHRHKRVYFRLKCFVKVQLAP